MAGVEVGQLQVTGRVSQKEMISNCEKNGRIHLQANMEIEQGDASVAKERVAWGWGWWRGAVEAKRRFAWSKAVCMSEVQRRLPFPAVASVKGLSTRAIPGRKRL